MRTFAVVTTCHEKGYELYGRQMLQSVDAHLPPDVRVHLYAEGFTPDYTSSRIKVHDLLKSCPDLVAFKERHKDNPLAHGKLGRDRLRVIVQWHKPRIKLRRVRWGDGYWWDAVRFSHKVFAIEHAAQTCGADVLFWMDADIFVFADITNGFLDATTPAEYVASCLRRPKFSECSFMGFNLKHPAIWNFLGRFVDLYRSDELFKQDQFHDSYLFDVIRRKFEKQGHRTFDIAAGAGKKSHHVFINSCLGACMDHMKGNRKFNGGSDASELLAPRTEAYWNSLLGSSTEHDETTQTAGAPVSFADAR